MFWLLGYRLGYIFICYRHDRIGKSRAENKHLKTFNKAIENNMRQDANIRGITLAVQQICRSVKGP